MNWKFILGGILVVGSQKYNCPIVYLFSFVDIYSRNGKSLVFLLLVNPRLDHLIENKEANQAMPTEHWHQRQ